MVESSMNGAVGFLLGVKVGGGGWCESLGLYPQSNL